MKIEFGFALWMLAAMAVFAIAAVASLRYRDPTKCRTCRHRLRDTELDVCDPCFRGSQW